MDREKALRTKKSRATPVIERGITTINASNRRKRPVPLPVIPQPKELDLDYLQALKVIDRTRRQAEAMPKTILRKTDRSEGKNAEASYQFSSTLTPVGQKAMVKTYEDTLITHLTHVYSSKRIAHVLPRLRTATFRHRLPPINNNNQTHVDSIHKAQLLIDNILNNNSQKDTILCDYVKWQHQWAQNC